MATKDRKDKMAAKSNSRGARLSAAEKRRIRELLMAKREQLLNDVRQLENGSLNKARKDASGDLSAVPYHMADLASDNYEQEFMLELIQNEDVGLREVEEALRRLEAGTYGICEGCSKPIRKARLKALPYAKMCIECQRKQEAGVSPHPSG